MAFKVLIFTASNKPLGKSVHLLDKFIDTAEEIELETRLINISALSLPEVSGKLENWMPNPRLKQLMNEADAFVINSPTHWFGPPVPLKRFIDNLTPLTADGLLDGKPVGCVIYGPEGGAGSLASWLGWVLNDMGCLLLPYSIIWQEGPHKDNNNSWIPMALEFLAKNMKAYLERPDRLKFGGNSRLAQRWHEL